MPTGPPSLAIVPGGDADVALAGADDARAVRPEQLHVREIALELVEEPGLVLRGHTFGDDHDEVDPNLRRPSMTALLTPAAGMKTHDALAPVASTASPTLAKIGMPSTSVPAFFGFVPATTCVPYSLLRIP